MKRTVATVLLVSLCIAAASCRNSGIAAADRISAKDRQTLAAWRPMSKTIPESHPELRILMAHRMSRSEIHCHLDRSVRIDRRSSARGSWYIPVAPSQGVDLIFDSSGKLMRVEPVGGPTEAWMTGNAEPPVQPDE